jgi:hypothetical protein
VQPLKCSPHRRKTNVKRRLATESVEVFGLAEVSYRIARDERLSEDLLSCPAIVCSAQQAKIVGRRASSQRLGNSMVELQERSLLASPAVICDKRTTPSISGHDLATNGGGDVDAAGDRPRSLWRPRRLVSALHWA